MKLLYELIQRGSDARKVEWRDPTRGRGGEAVDYTTE